MPRHATSNDMVDAIDDNLAKEESTDIEDYVKLLSRSEIIDCLEQLTPFMEKHRNSLRPICLVSSGGTVVDLEINAVRSLENFSTGLRGAIAVEELLHRGYCVVHLWRQGSASPFARVLSQFLELEQTNHGLNIDCLGKLFAIEGEDADEDLVQTVIDEENDRWMTTSIDSNYGDGKSKVAKNSDGLSLNRRLSRTTAVMKALHSRSDALQEGRLITIPFRTVEQYLGKLQLCCMSLNQSKSLAMVFLAAAVSDFYIPAVEKTEHKIQSQASDDGLTLHLKPVPKVMGRIRQSWAQDSFLVSFKLETDKDILRQKAELAVEKYGCHMVIGNLLQTRHEQVCILAPVDYTSDSRASTKEWTMDELTKGRGSNADSLESSIIDFVMQSHFEYISFHFRGDSSGIESLQLEHEKKQLEKSQLSRSLFWNRAKSIGLEALGAVLTLFISYTINATLQRRYRSG